MRCHVCNVDVGEGQQFCHGCGESLDGVTEPTQQIEAVAAAPDDVVPDPDHGDTAPRAALVEPPTFGPPDGAATVEGSVGDAPDSDPVGSTAELAAPDGSGEIDLRMTEAIPITAGPDEPISDASDGSATEADDAESGVIDLRMTEAVAVVPAPDIAPPTVDEPMPMRLPDPVWSSDPPSAPLIDETSPTTRPTPLEDDPLPIAPPPAATVVHQSTTALPTSSAGVFDDARAAAGPPPAPQGPQVRQPVRLRTTFVLGLLATVATVLASIADVTDIRTDRVVPGIDNELRMLADFGTNLPIGGFIGAAAMLIGGLLHCFGFRWGAGFAGGSGLAVAGWSAITLGLAQVSIDQAQRVVERDEIPFGFTLTTSWELGYWLIVAVGVIGLLTFGFSLVSAGSGGRRGLNPWTAALGALAAVVTAAGALITVNGISLSANLGTSNLPWEFFTGRLVQVALIVVAGVVGFLVVRAYGLGLAAGGMTIPIWLWLTSLIELGDRPIGIAVGNLGSDDTSPHAVTTVGVALSVAMMLLAVIAAAVQVRRSSPPAPTA